jgi:hypothetical protein
MNDNNISRHVIVHQLKWLGVYMGIALVISFLLSFPYNFIAVPGALFMINLLEEGR